MDAVCLGLLSAMGAAIAALATWAAKQARDKDKLRDKIDDLRKWQIGHLQEDIHMYREIGE